MECDTLPYWSNNSIVKQFQVHSVNIISIKTKLMAICTGLIPAIEMNNIYDIYVITDSITAACHNLAK